MGGQGASGRILLPIALGGVCVLFFFSCDAPSTIDPDAAPLYERDMSEGIFDTAPVRGERGPLMLRRDGDEYECSMCHDGFEGDLGAEALQGEHADIVFDHGLNLLCLNCHHPTNSDVFVYHDGSEIPGDEATRLCAKCHGPHFREWTLDVHGRVSGSWQPDSEEKKKLDCIQCHDPHRPKFQRMEPEPPPVLTRFELETRQGEPHDQ